MLGPTVHALTIRSTPARAHATAQFAAWSVVLLLVLYCTYVAAVLAADVWHRASKRWRTADPELLQSLLRVPDDFSSAAPVELPPLVDMPPSRRASTGSLAGGSGAQEDDDGGTGGLLSGADASKGFSRQQIMGMGSREYTLRAWASIAHSGSFMRLSGLLSGGSGNSGDAGRCDGHTRQGRRPAPPSADTSAGWQPHSPSASHEPATIGAKCRGEPQGCHMRLVCVCGAVGGSCNQTQESSVSRGNCGVWVRPPKSEREKGYVLLLLCCCSCSATTCLSRLPSAWPQQQRRSLASSSR